MSAAPTRRPVAGLLALFALLAGGAGGSSSQAASGAAEERVSSLDELRWSADGATLVGIGDRGKKAAAFRAYDGANGKPTWSLPLASVREPTRGKPLEVEEWQPSAVPGELLIAAQGDLFLAAAAGATVRRLTSTPEAEEGATLSPDGSRVAFVRQGDLWAIELASGKETRLTDDGRPPALVNGARPQPAQEIFAGGAGFAWAPESRTIAFLRKNGDSRELTTVTVLAPAPQTMETGSPSDGELTEVHWRFDARALGVERRSVAGDRYDLLLCHPEKRYCRPLAHRAADRAGAPRRDFWFLADGFLWSSTVAKRDALARFDTIGRERQPIPADDWSVERIEAEDELAGLFLVSATRATPSGGSERALLRLSSTSAAPQALASDSGSEVLVSPTASRIVLTVAATDGGVRRELRAADGKTVATLPPPS